MIHYLGLCVRYLILLLLCGVTVSFVLSNDQPVVLQLFPLPFEVTIPVYALTAILLVGGLCVGLSFGSLYSTGKILRLRKELREKTHRLHAMHQEMTALELEREGRLNFSAPRAAHENIAFLPAEAVGQ
jgi:uncharacterized integral membrane protein